MVLVSVAVINLHDYSTMSTYADYFNEHYEGEMPSGPVRLTTSKRMLGAQDMDTDGNSEEVWEVEDLMDNDDSAADQCDNKHGHSHTTKNSLESLTSSLSSLSSVWVLDTCVYTNRNVLLDEIHTLCEIVDIQESHIRNSDSTFLQLVIPHVVLDELDALKNSPNLLRGSSTTIGNGARRASRWILDVMQRQKYTVSLPPHLWPLQVEITATDLDTTNDQQIISLCEDIISHVRARVYLISNDVNARIRAEAANVSSIALGDITAHMKTRGNVGAFLAIMSAFPQTRDIPCHEIAIRTLPDCFWHEMKQTCDAYITQGRAMIE